MNRRNWLAAACIPALLTGCHRAPDFGSPEEEYRYLRSLSNPTPEQYLRRKELADQESEDRPRMGSKPGPGGHWTVRDAVESEDEGQAAFDRLPR